jgi:Zn-dependent protease with chaperone function
MQNQREKQDEGEYTYLPVADKVPMLVRVCKYVPALAVCLLGMVLIVKYNRFLPFDQFRLALYATVGLSAFTWAGTYFGALWKTRKPLPKTEPIYERALSLAQRCGVSVDHIFVYPSNKVDAYRTTLGSLCLSSKLVREMDNAEIEVYIAHALYLDNFRWTVSISIIFNALLNLYSNDFKIFIRDYFHLPNITSEMIIKLTIAFLYIVNFVFATHWLDKHKKRADIFTAKIVSDTEFTIRTLLKGHYLSEGNIPIVDGAAPSSLRERFAYMREQVPQELHK